MSLLYSILKPVVRKVVKDSSLHREQSYEEFKKASYEVQRKFRFSLPSIKEFEFHDEPLDGFHVIIGKQKGTDPDRAIVYFPGGGSRKWQLPYRSSLRNYIRDTSSELWIPLFPLLPDYDLLDETEFIIKLHRKMLERFCADKIVWLGFSGGGDVLLQTGRHIVKEEIDIPMPSMMIAVSASGLLVSEEAKKRMKEIDPRDPLLHWDMFDTMIRYYDPDGNLPKHILGKADEDDYTGFPKVIMYFAGDEVFAGIAPDYEKSFIRCHLKDYEIKVREGMFHAWPVFTFLKEGREGEREIIEDIRAHFNNGKSRR